MPECLMNSIAVGGGLYLGITTGPAGEALVWFTDPQTESTLMMPATAIRSAEDVRQHMEESRAKFKPEVRHAHQQTQI